MAGAVRDDGTLLLASLIGLRALAADEGRLTPSSVFPAVGVVPDRGALARAAGLIGALRPEQIAALSSAAASLSDEAFQRLLAADPRWSEVFAALPPVQGSAAAVALGTGDPDRWRPMAIAGAIALLVAVAQIEVQGGWDGVQQAVTLSFHKHPGIPAEVVGIVGAVAAAMTGRRRGEPGPPAPGATAPEGERPPPTPPEKRPATRADKVAPDKAGSGSGPAALPSKPAAGTSPADDRKPSAAVATRTVAERRPPAPAVVTARLEHLPLADAEGVLHQIETMAREERWREPGCWKAGRPARARRFSAVPSGKTHPENPPPTTLGTGLIRVPARAGQNAAAFRIALRIGTERFMASAAMKQLRTRLDKLFGNVVSVRATTPIMALARTGRPRPPHPLMIGASIAATQGAEGSVALLTKTGTDFFAVTAGHIFLNDQAQPLVGADAYSPAMQEPGTVKPVGRVSHVSVFPELPSRVPPVGGGDIGMVTLRDPGLVPFEDMRRRFDGHLAASVIYPRDPSDFDPDQRIVKAAGATPLAHGNVTGFNITLDYFYPMTGQTFRGTGLLEVTLANMAPGPYRLAPGDSGVLCCAEDAGYQPIGLIVAGAVLEPRGEAGSGRPNDLIVAYVQMFRDNIHLQGMEIL